MPRLGSFALAPTAQYPLWLYQSFDRQYFRKVQSTRPQDLIGYWPMWEPSGVVANDLSPQVNNGAYEGATLLKAGIGDGRSCPLFDGTNDYMKFYSAGFSADFDGTKGTIMAWMKVLNAGIWTDDDNNQVIMLRADANNYVDFRLHGNNNSLVYEYSAGGTWKGQILAGYSDTDWMHLALTWDKANDELKFYVGGAQVGATQSSLGVWAETIPSGGALVGVSSTAPGSPFSGWIAHPAVWKGVLSAQEILRLS